MAWNFKIITLAGVIDSDYRGPIQVMLYNLDPYLSFRGTNTYF